MTSQEVALTKTRKRFAVLLAALSMLASSCNVSSLLAAGATATAGNLGTTAAQTAEAASTQTAAMITPTETLTLTPLPTPTETFTPTETPTPFLSASEGQFSCRVLSQSVRNGAHYSAGQRFEMGWKVRNNGDLDWDPGVVDFAYFSGTKMYQAEFFSLPEGVHTGAAVGLSASLAAPKKPGIYTTTWALRRGENHFCYVSLRIVVP